MPMELDYKTNEFMDDQKQWIICSTMASFIIPFLVDASLALVADKY
jgi:hypothetical protein